MPSAPHLSDHAGDRPDLDWEDVPPILREARGWVPIRQMQAYQAFAEQDGWKFVVLAFKAPDAAPANEPGVEPKWVEPFLGELRHVGQVNIAAELAGVSRQTVYRRRQTHPGFAQSWADALKDREELRDIECDDSGDEDECYTFTRVMCET